jgi:hypothetical protein
MERESKLVFIRTGAFLTFFLRQPQTDKQASVNEQVSANAGVNSPTVFRDSKDHAACMSTLLVIRCISLILDGLNGLRLSGSDFVLTGFQRTLSIGTTCRLHSSGLKHRTGYVVRCVFS